MYAIIPVHNAIVSAKDSSHSPERTRFLTLNLLNYNIDFGCGLCQALQVSKKILVFMW